MIFRFGEIRNEFRYGKVGLIIIDIAILSGAALASAGLLLAGYMLIFAYCSDIWILTPLSIMVYVLSYILYKWLRNPFYRKFVEASQVLTAEAGQPAVLSFPGAMGYSGLLVELKDNQLPGSGSKILSVGLPRKVKTPKGDLPIVFRSDSKSRLSTAVVQISEGFFVASVRSKEDMRQEMLRMRRLLVALFWAGVVAVGLISAYMAIENNRLNTAIERALASVNFPTVEAHIISSKLVETKVRRGKVPIRAWYPEIQYAYSLGGEYLIGGQFSAASDVYFDKHEAEEVVSRYPPNSIHNLYYDPNDLDFTVLEPGHQESLISERTVFLAKWAAILIAVIALTVVFKLCLKRLLPDIFALIERVYGVHDSNL